MQDKIELLSVNLLDEQRPLVEQLKKLAKSLGLEFGWHYLLDLSWILSQIPQAQGKRIIDAGAGTGVIQWHLAQQGAEVISIDRSSRAHLAPHFRNRFQVSGYRKQDLTSAAEAARVQAGKVKGVSGKLTWLALEALRSGLPGGLGKSKAGRVLIYNQDLMNLTDIQSSSVDAVVAVSSLEHNTPENLPKVVDELLRVIKPGGQLLATLGASEREDWFHQPSQGWNYSEASLRSMFRLSPQAASNYGCYRDYLHALKNNAELRDNLAGFYQKSGDNGMPWGKWDPQYLVAGVCKIKPAE